MEAAHRETRRDARLELERRPQEEAPQRAAVLVVVRRLATGRREADRAQGAAVIVKLRRVNRTVRGRTLLARELLERQPEVVARLQPGIEIDLARKDVRQRDREIGSLASGLHGLEQRRRPVAD